MVRSLIAATGIAVVCLFLSVARAAQNDSLRPRISPVMPYTVTDHDPNLPLAEIHPFFDHFSWQSFIALNWPVELNADGVPIRGRANARSSLNNTRVPRVWESWKADFELFTTSPAPLAWGDYPPVELPCIQNASYDLKLLPTIAGTRTVLDTHGINQAMASPLIDQSRKYLRYEIRLNETEYTTIRNAGWYVPGSLPLQVEFPSSTLTPSPQYGAIEVKAAWKELEKGESPKRFYTRNATIVEPGTPHTCRTATVALVGMHIAHKTAPSREWVWSTFEHVDLVPETTSSRPRKRYILHNNDTSFTQTLGYDYLPEQQNPDEPFPPVEDRVPVQVTRVNPIFESTQAMNKRYQKALSGTVWKNYKLVGTQWPTVPNGAAFQAAPAGSYVTDCGMPFPLHYLPNLAMETYLQKEKPGRSPNPTSCMGCHFNASSADFSWVLKRRTTPESSRQFELRLEDFTPARTQSIP